MCELRRRESRGHNGLTAVMPAAGKHSLRHALVRIEKRPAAVSVAAPTIFATDRFVGSVESIPSELFDKALENCRAQTEKCRALPIPQAPASVRYACVRDPRVVTPSGVFFIRFHADRLVIRLKPMDGKMTVPQQHALFPNALSDVLGTLNTQKRSIGRRSRAQWSRPRTCEER